MKYNKIFASIAMLAIALSSCSEDSMVKVTGINLSNYAIKLSVGGTETLTAEVLPDNATDKTVEWSSMTESVATVSQEGVVTAVGIGETVITAMCSGLMATCSVEVTEIMPESISIVPESLSLDPGESAVLNVTVYPEGASVNSFVWASSDVEIAEVDDKGNVVAVATGEVEIMVQAGDLAAKCSVRVNDLPDPGDYVYADGTFSKDLQAGKEVVGIVFWGGDATADDPILRKEHPGCTNGLAVAITEFDEGMYWQSKNPDYQKGLPDYKGKVGYWLDENRPEYETIVSSLLEGDNLNRTLGYNNTSAIREFNADAANSGWPVEAVQRIEEYAQEHELPESFSGWYLPSEKELHLLCEGEIEGSISFYNQQFKNRDIVNASLSKIDGAVQLASVTRAYWSSTEYYQMGTMMIDFTMNYQAGANPSAYTKNAVRYIFAF